MSDANNSVPPLPPPFLAAVEKLRSWCGEQLKLEETANKITKPLYHYTNAGGLRGIFESERIWFTDHRHLNDPSELLQGMEEARRAATRLKPNFDARAQMLLDFLIDLFRHENITKLEYYIASFSRARNDLGQWRAYADNGRGFAIGFSPQMFEVVTHAPADQPPEFIGVVDYTLDEGKGPYTPPILEGINTFLSVADLNPHLMKDKRIGIPFMQEIARALIASQLLWRSLTTKHPAYKHEEEVRLVIVGLATKLMPYVKTRLRGSEIVPYIAHPWPVRTPGNIVEIVVGPASPPDTERTLQKFLRILGMDFDAIGRSDIPYRPLG